MMKCLKYIDFILIGVLFVSCNNATNKRITVNKEKQDVINNYNKYVFSLTKIESKNILDSLKILSDTIFTDTANYYRTPKATLYINNEARTIDQIFEDPKGVITVMRYCKEGKEIYIQEYYTNGQVKCKFSVTNNGVRNGDFTCFYENGNIRKSGVFENGRQTKTLDLKDKTP